MIAAYEPLSRHNSSVDGPIHACLARSARQKSGQKAANRPQSADEAEEEDMNPYLVISVTDFQSLIRRKFERSKSRHA